MSDTVKLNIIDVGCGQKIDVEWKKKKNVELVDFFLGFDISSNVDSVKKRFLNRIIYNCAVFDEEGTRPFYHCNYPRCSSLFRPDPDMVKYFVRKSRLGSHGHHRLDVKEIEDVKCMRLDTIISELNIDFDFIKIDTQGAEFQVIKSLGKYLNTQIVGMKVELFRKRLYQDIVLYPKVNKFLNNNGFVRVKKFNKNRIDGDFLYLRKDFNDDVKRDKIKLIKKIYKIK